MSNTGLHHRSSQSLYFSKNFKEFKEYSRIYNSQELGNVLVIQGIRMVIGN